MNDRSAEQLGRSSKRGFRIRSWAPIVLWLPVLACVTIATWIGIREWSAASEYKLTIAALAESGSPVDDRSMEQLFLAGTHTEGTVQWAEIIDVMTSIDIPHRHSPNSGLPLNVEPGGDWEHRAEFASFAERMQPAIHAIVEAAQFPTPVWQPVRFNGYFTFFGSAHAARQVGEVLRVDAEVAMDAAESERVLRDITALKSVADAFDWAPWAVTQLVHLSHEGQRWGVIQRSLQADLWSAEQLDVLVDLVGPPQDVDRKLQSSIKGERALSLAQFDDIEAYQAALGDSFPTPMAGAWPSSRVSYLKGVERKHAILQGGIRRLPEILRQTETIDAQPGESTIPFGDNLSAIIRAYIRHENRRRITLLVLAVKRHKVIHGEWPATLETLVGEGLDPMLLRSVNTTRFRYAIAKGVATIWDPAVESEYEGGGVRSESGDVIPPTPTRVDPKSLSWETRSGSVVGVR